MHLNGVPACCTDALQACSITAAAEVQHAVKCSIQYAVESQECLFDEWWSAASAATPFESVSKLLQKACHSVQLQRACQVEPF